MRRIEPFCLPVCVIHPEAHSTLCLPVCVIHPEAHSPPSLCVLFTLRRIVLTPLPVLFTLRRIVLLLFLCVIHHEAHSAPLLPCVLFTMRRIGPLGMEEGGYPAYASMVPWWSYYPGIYTQPPWVHRSSSPLSRTARHGDAAHAPLPR